MKLPILLAALPLVLPHATTQTVRATTLVELGASPGRLLGEEVEFTLQFQALVEGWNPYLSRFEPGRWLALSAWPDEVFTWDAASYDAPSRRMFTLRGTPLEATVRHAVPYQRFRATAIVREQFLGEPWLELTSLTRLAEEVGEGTILHVTRARELVLEGNYDLALEQYERARLAPLPSHALAAILEEQLETREARDQAAGGTRKSKKSAPEERKP